MFKTKILFSATKLLYILVKVLVGFVPVNITLKLKKALLVVIFISFLVYRGIIENSFEHSSHNCLCRFSAAYSSVRAEMQDKFGVIFGQNHVVMLTGLTGAICC